MDLLLLRDSDSAAFQDSDRKIHEKIFSKLKIVHIKQARIITESKEDEEFIRKLFVKLGRARELTEFVYEFYFKKFITEPSKTVLATPFVNLASLRKLVTVVIGVNDMSISQKLVVWKLVQYNHSTLKQFNLDIYSIDCTVLPLLLDEKKMLDLDYLGFECSFTEIDLFLLRRFHDRWRTKRLNFSYSSYELASEQIYFISLFSFDNHKHLKGALKKIKRSLPKTFDKDYLNHL